MSSATAAAALPRRVMLERPTPAVDGGAYPAKRVVGERVDVEVDAFADGHDVIAVDLIVAAGAGVDVDVAAAGTRIPMRPAGNDAWRGSFSIDKLAPYAFTIEAWIDEVASWHAGLEKKIAAGQDVAIELAAGEALLTATAARASGEHARVLRQGAAGVVRARKLEPEVLAAARAHPDPRRVTRLDKPLRIDVDRERARFSSWYEFFPRSASSTPGAHGTLRDCIARLDYVKSLGFDVVYLPPIHPIGVTARKGKDNAPTAAPGDVGSPWAIGGKDGGHDAVHKELGTVDDLVDLVLRARSLDMEVALDIAFQCSPDHPWVREHPEWFKKRPDGSIQYAENPPKKYQDIFPLDLDGEHWQPLWAELLRMLLFWVERGVRIFRVDNPHTKPFALWQYLIAAVRREHPDVFFLAEAFTRPKPMYRLAKLGFAQSYNYFPWRNTKAQLTAYLEEVTRPPVRDFFRANLWPNTPDILPERLQVGGRAVFTQRLVLAATLGASYGIYGPAFELGDAAPREPGAEEYARSEKYEIKRWNLDDDGSLRDVIAQVNRIRRANPALQRDDTLRFVPVDNDELIAFVKTHGEDAILVVVNLDPHHVQSGHVDVPLDALGLDEKTAYQAHDLLGGGRYFWSGARSFVEIDPSAMPAQIFKLLRKVRTERDFDYFF